MVVLQGSKIFLFLEIYFGGSWNGKKRRQEQRQKQKLNTGILRFAQNDDVEEVTTLGDEDVDGGRTSEDDDLEG